MALQSICYTLLVSTRTKALVLGARPGFTSSEAETSPWTFDCVDISFVSVRRLAVLCLCHMATGQAE